MRSVLCLLLATSTLTAQEKPTEFTNIRLFEAFVQIQADACREAEDTKNKLTIKKARAEAISQLSKAFKGKMVSWKVEVVEVEDGRVILDGRVADNDAELHNNTSPPDQNVNLLKFEVAIGKGVTANHAEKLKAGDKVTITAKVREVVFIGGDMNEFPVAVGLEGVAIP